MIMKQYLYLILLAANCSCVFAQTPPGLPEHTWKITLKVLDEVGNPVPHVNAGVGFFTNSQPASIDGITDTNGLFVASQTVESSGGGYTFGFSAEKDGYYTTRSGFYLDAKYDAVKWNPTVTLTLKKVGKPVAMYAKQYVMGLKVPEYGKPIAYDFEVGDWVGPYGKGIKKDIIFQKEYYDKGAGGYYSKVTVSFPKEADGIQVCTIPDSEKGSGLRSPHEAPQDGYLAEISREVSALHGQPSKNEHDPNRIYLFRVRTVKNDNGKIVSAHYGKIYGDFMQFTYYLNPTPNDRNIEFDPKQNLIHSLDSLEQVSAP